MKVPLRSLRFPLRCFMDQHWHTEPIMEINICSFDMIPNSSVNAISYTLIFGLYRSMKAYDTIDDIVSIITRLRERIQTEWTVIKIRTLSHSLSVSDALEEILFYVDIDDVVHFTILPCQFTNAHETLRSKEQVKTQPSTLFQLCAEQIPYHQKLIMKELLLFPFDIMPAPVAWLISNHQ